MKSLIQRIAFALVALVSVGTTASAVGDTTGNYTLRTNDRIEVRVYQEEDLTQAVTVNRDGTVRLSLVGALPVAGLTANEAAERISRAYDADYIVNPQVTVNVLGYAKREVTIQGQVGKQGSVNIKPGQDLSLVQAIAEAGGFTRLANQRAVYVKRSTAAGEQIFKVNVKKLATEPGLPAFILREGDIVTVREALF